MLRQTPSQQRREPEHVPTEREQVPFAQNRFRQRPGSESHWIPVVSGPVQGWVSVRGCVVHAPPLHTRSLQVREYVPAVAQTSANPPHAPKLPQLVAPQLVPSVLRGQPCVSVRTDPWQLPPPHA